MPTLIFIEPDGVACTVSARVGETVMRAARAAGVTGIIGECGGSMNCLTCHCYVSSADWDRIAPAAAVEREMLDCVMEVRENSRLACQIVVTADLDGATFIVPAWQG